MVKTTKKENKKKMNKEKLKKFGKKVSSFFFETTGKTEDEIIDFTIDKGASILKRKIRQKRKKG